MQNQNTKQENALFHAGVKGMKKGVRRWTNPDGSLTPEGVEHYRQLYGYEAREKKVVEEQKTIRKENKLKYRNELSVGRQQTLAALNQSRTDKQISRQEEETKRKRTAMIGAAAIIGILGAVAIAKNTNKAKVSSAKEIRKGIESIGDDAVAINNANNKTLKKNTKQIVKNAKNIGDSLGSIDINQKQVKAAAKNAGNVVEKAAEVGKQLEKNDTIDNVVDKTKQMKKDGTVDKVENSVYNFNQQKKKKKENMFSFTDVYKLKTSTSENADDKAKQMKKDGTVDKVKQTAEQRRKERKANRDWEAAYKDRIKKRDEESKRKLIDDKYHNFHITDAEFEYEAAQRKYQKELIKQDLPYSEIKKLKENADYKKSVLDRVKEAYSALGNKKKVVKMSDDDIFAYLGIDETICLEHHGVKGMKWGRHIFGENQELNVKAYTKTIDNDTALNKIKLKNESDERIAKLENKTNLAKAKMDYKSALKLGKMKTELALNETSADITKAKYEKETQRRKYKTIGLASVVAILSLPTLANAIKHADNCDWDPNKHDGRPCPTHAGGGLFKDINKADDVGSYIKKRNEYDTAVANMKKNYANQLKSAYVSKGMNDKDAWNKANEEADKKVNSLVNNLLAEEEAKVNAEYQKELIRRQNEAVSSLFKGVSDVSNQVANILPAHNGKTVYGEYPELTDEYMKQFIDRKNLEKRYSDAVGDTKYVKSGSEKAREILQTVGAVAGIALTLSQLKRAGGNKNDKKK